MSSMTSHNPPATASTTTTSFESFLGSIFRSSGRNVDQYNGNVTRIDGYRNGHYSSKRKGVDSKLRFSINPLPGEDAFCQWRDAMRAVARLPLGIPAEFRKKVWLALADNYLNSLGIDWEKTRRFAFNERSNPDDNKLGLQIVKDLHRTGCSGFSGHDNEEERALLKRVLLAYARWNKSVGYCQGFNVLAALILDVVERKEDHALKVMIFLIDHVLPPSYFTNNLRALSVDMAVFRDLLNSHVPDLADHLDYLQKAARDEDLSGANYEPPLTNVFTMQWFLTLFATCLPEDTALRVWDSVLLEGSEILLRTALAIWARLKPRILEIESADEFYSTMGVLTQEMLDSQIIDADQLVKMIYNMAAFPFPQLGELREKYTYNITPFSAAMSTGGQKSRRSGKTSIFSDDDEVFDDEELVMENIGCFTAFMGQQMTRGGHKTELSENDRSPSASHLDMSRVTPGAYAVDPGEKIGAVTPPPAERTTLDLHALKQQYMKVRQRQRQAHVILTAANARHQANMQRGDQRIIHHPPPFTHNTSSSPSASLLARHSNHVTTKTLAPPIESPVAVNHLFLGRDMRKHMKNSGKNRAVVEGPKIAASYGALPGSFSTTVPQKKYEQSQRSRSASGTAAVSNSCSSQQHLLAKSYQEESLLEEEHCNLDDLPGLYKAPSVRSIDSEVSATSLSDYQQYSTGRGTNDSSGASDTSTVCASLASPTADSECRDDVFLSDHCPTSRDRVPDTGSSFLSDHNPTSPISRDRDPDTGTSHGKSSLFKDTTNVVSDNRVQNDVSVSNSDDLQAISDTSVQTMCDANVQQQNIDKGVISDCNSVSSHSNALSDDHITGGKHGNFVNTAECNREAVSHSNIPSDVCHHHGSEVNDEDLLTYESEKKGEHSSEVIDETQGQIQSMSIREVEDTQHSMNSKETLELANKSSSQRPTLLALSANQTASKVLGREVVNNKITQASNVNNSLSSDDERKHIIFSSANENLSGEFGAGRKQLQQDSGAGKKRHYVRHTHIDTTAWNKHASAESDESSVSSPPPSSSSSSSSLESSPNHHHQNQRYHHSKPATSAKTTHTQSSVKVFNPFPSRHINHRRAQNGVRLGLYSAGRVPQVEVGMLRSTGPSVAGRAQSKVNACVHRHYMEEVVKKNGAK